MILNPNPPLGYIGSEGIVCMFYGGDFESEEREEGIRFGPRSSEGDGGWGGMKLNPTYRLVNTQFSLGPQLQLGVSPGHEIHARLSHSERLRRG